MNFDIRIPIGLLFTVLGLILAVFGLFTVPNHIMYAKSLGVNFNLIWGLVMVVFGVIMLWKSNSGKKEKIANKKNE